MEYRNQYHRCLMAIAIGMLSILGAVTCGKSPLEKTHMSQQTSKLVTRQCLGRFCLDVPTSMTRKNDSFSLQYVSIEEVLWKNPNDKAREVAWKKRLASIKALEARREIPTDISGEILAKRELAPGLQGVMFHEDDNPELISWGGSMSSGPVDVWLQLDGDLEREREWAERLVEIAHAYQPLKAEQSLPVPGKNWFYLRHGLIMLPMKFQEAAQVSFEERSLGLKLIVTTRTVSRVKKQGTMDWLPNSLANLVINKKRSREVAGLKGEEFILSHSEGKRDQLYCLWTYVGEVKSGSAPRITIELESSLEQYEDRVALWNQVLESVRPAAQ